LEDDAAEEMKLPTHFTVQQRKYAHSIAEHHSLKHVTSQGGAGEKYVLLSKSRLLDKDMQRPRANTLLGGASLEGRRNRKGRTNSELASWSPASAPTPVIGPFSPMMPWIPSPWLPPGLEPQAEMIPFDLDMNGVLPPPAMVWGDVGGDPACGQGLSSEAWPGFTGLEAFGGAYPGAGAAFDQSAFEQHMARLGVPVGTQSVENAEGNRSEQQSSEVAIDNAAAACASSSALPDLCTQPRSSEEASSTERSSGPAVRSSPPSLAGTISRLFARWPCMSPRAEGKLTDGQDAPPARH
jgi:hypothetical protein